MASPHGFRKLLPATAAPLGALALVAALGALGSLGTLDRAWFDLLQRRTASISQIPANTAFVLVDEESMRALGSEQYGYRWPWPRRAFGALFASLHRAGAKAVVADLIFLEGSEDPMQDIELGSVAAGLPEVILGAMPARPGKPEQLPVIWPQAFRTENAALFAGRPRWGYVNSSPDEDSVIRRYALADSLAWAAAGDALPAGAVAGSESPVLLRWRGNLEQSRARGVPVVPAALFVVDGLPVMKRASEVAADLEPGPLVRAIDAEPPPQEALLKEAFAKVRGRTVFVGVNAASTFDFIATPCGAPEPGVVSHWTAYANLTSGGFLREAGPWSSAGALALVIAALAWAGRGGIGLRRPAVVAGCGLVLALGGSAAGFLGGVWFAPMLPVAGVAAGFGATAVQSFLLERARKREIQGWFGSYVSPAVVEQLIHNPDSLKLGGERRDLTVYFSDLAGFTTLSEKLPPDQLVSLMNLFLEELTECVLKEGCYLDKYIGDAIMAVFGSPERLENHALSACRAALASQRRLAVLNDRIEREHGLRLGMRVGVNTGDMVVGNVGSAKKRNYTVLGDAVNLAARLEGANKEFGTAILIGPLTAAALGGALVTRPVARLQVKGKKQAVEVHELVGEPESLDEPARRFLAAYGEGYGAYCSRRFAEAHRAFVCAAALRPGDFLATRYADESQRLVNSAPPADWEPILELHTK